MDIKKELFWGLGITFFIIALSVYYILSFQKQTIDKPKTTRLPATSVNMTLTTAEIAKHNQESDCWIIVENKVYNVTGYLSLHPDGGKIIIPYCGQEATQAYLAKDGQGAHSQRADQDLESLYIGDFGGKKIK